MELSEAVVRLSALAHDARLQVFRMLVRAGPEGIAAGEACPLWPGQPITAHWGVADPAAAEGSDEDKRKAFLKAFTELSTRINLMLALPIDKLDRQALTGKLKEIGTS